MFLRRFLILIFLLVTNGYVPDRLPSALRADDQYRPLVVVCLSSYEKLVKDIACLSDPRLTALLAGLIGRNHATPVDPLTLAPVGLDVRRPWGLVVETDGQTFPIHGFIPVTDLEKLLAGAVQSGKIRPPEEGVYVIKFADRKWYLRQKGNWAIFAGSSRELDLAPADPMKMLEGLHKTGDLAISIAPEHLPAEVRQLAQRWIKEGHRLAVTREPGQTTLNWALYNSLVNQGLQLAALAVDEGESLTASVSMDVVNRSLIADASVVFKPDSEMDQSLNAPSRTKTGFGGFSSPQAAVTGLWTGEAARMPLHHVLCLLDSVWEQLLPSNIGAPGSELWQTIRHTLLAEDVDGGAVVIIRTGNMTLLAGGYVSETDALRQKLELLTRGTTSTDGLRWKLDTSRLQGVRLYLLSLPIPKDAADRGKLVRLFGDPLELAVGIGNHALYVAAGRNPVEALKNAVRHSRTKSGKKTAPIEFVATLGPVFRLAAELAPPGDRQAMAEIASLLEQSGGRDHVRLTARTIPRGIHARLKVEEAVLRAAAAMAQQ